MTSQVERVARIISEFPEDCDWGKVTAAQRAKYERLARCAIIAVLSAERDRIVEYARKLNYGPTLRTFVKHIVREYHITWGKDGLPVEAEEPQA